MAVKGHRVWKVQVAHLQLSKKESFLFCMWFLHQRPELTPLVLLSHFRQTALSFEFSCKLAVIQGYCFLGLPFGTALNFHCTFQSLFSLRNRFVIQGVQCDRVLLGRFSKNKPVKWPHSLQYVLNVWACMEVLQKSVFMVWLGSVCSSGCCRMNWAGPVSLFNLLFESSIETLFGAVVRWTGLSQQTMVVITKPSLIRTAAHHLDIKTSNLL